MSENKFIRHLQGKDTAKSVLEIRNQKTPTSFANMPDGTSNANDVYSDRRGDAAGVLKGTENWKLNNSLLIETSTVYGDGRDFTDDFEVGGSGLWVNATCTFTTARRFAPNTKFVLKLCGHDLDTVAEQTVGFTLIVKFGSTVITKVFSVPVQAFDFCKEFEIDFGESNSSAIKVAANSTMQVQLLCADANAQATIYNGMTVFTALQRRVDSETVSSDTLSLDEIETDLTTHIANKNNPHEVTKAQVGLGNCDNTSDLDKPISTATQTALDGKVSIDGSSIMTGPLKMRATSSFQCAIAPFWDGVGFFKLNSDDSVTLIASIDTPDGFLPWVTNTYNIGSSLKKWKNLYLAGTAYITKINNGYDLLVPARSGTLATKEEVDLAANSGRMILDQGVWYAKMYAATVAPAAEDGTNYADFSQVDGQGNPIIVTYNRVNGAWVQDQTITPPTDYDGYVAVTAKIWDITEQAGQQGGRILWNHQSKEFTPYPQIISFDGQNITNSTFSYGTIVNSTFSGTVAITGGTLDGVTLTNADFTGIAQLSGGSTVTMSAAPTLSDIVNVGYVLDHQGSQNIKDETFVVSAMTISLVDDKSIYYVDVTDVNTDTTITIDTSNLSVSAGKAKTFEIHITCSIGTPSILWSGIDSWLKYSLTSPIEANATSIFALRVYQRPSDATKTVVANYGGAY